MKSYNTVEKNKLYSGKIFDLYQEKILVDDHKIITRDTIRHRSAAACIAVDENNNMILVRQYRHAISEYIFEIPAGLMEVGEDPKTTALRELHEETGYVAQEATFISKICTSAGFCDEFVYIYLAKNLKKDVQNLDQDEDLQIVYLSQEDAFEKIKNGLIIDAKTVAAIFMYKYMSNNI